MNEIVTLLLRHFATTIAGSLITHGYAGGYTAEQIAGGIVMLVTIGFSWWNKRGHVDALAAMQRAKQSAEDQLKALRKPPAASVGTKT
jgi:hypothetical protein